MVNVGADHVFLPKGQVVGILDSECTHISEIELDIAIITVNAIDSPTTIKEKVSKKSQYDMPSDLSLVLPMLQDLIKLIYKTLRKQKKKLKLSGSYAKNIQMCFLKILVTLVECH